MCNVNFIASVIRVRRAIPVIPEKKSFVVDRPFVFIVVENVLKNVLFVGINKKIDADVAVHDEL